MRVHSPLIASKQAPGQSGGASRPAFAPDELPEGVLVLLASSLDDRSLAAAQLVGRAWCSAFSRAVHALEPALLPPGGRLAQRFPCLESLGTSRCVGAAVEDEHVAALAPLTRLSRLSLRGAAAGGDGLAALAALSRVADLDLSACRRLDPAALRVLGSLPALRRLVLDQCARVDDGALAHVGAASALRELSLGGCSRVAGPGLAHLRSLSALTALRLAGLPALRDASLAALAALRALRELQLDRCSGLSGLGLAALAPLPALRVLSLLECEVGDAALRALAPLRALSRLTLDYCCRVSDAGLAALAALPELRALALRGCEGISGLGFSAFASPGCCLESVDLSWCPNLLVPGYEALGQVPSLTELNLLRCGVSNRQAAALAPLTALRVLSLANSAELTCGGIEAVVAGCTNLDRLDINGCAHVGDATLRAVATLPCLASLNLCGCKRLSDEGVGALAAATRLTEVNLAHSSVGDVAPLRKLPSLKRLNLLGCRLAELPDWAAPGTPPCSDIVLATDRAVRPSVC